MNNYKDFNSQFKLTREDYLEKLDILNWYRYFAIIKILIVKRPNSILEIGPGEGTIKNVFKHFTKEYQTMDVNEKLKPDYNNKIQEQKVELLNKFECVIAADVLEHIPFEELEKALNNLYAYLKSGGEALITIPHHSHYLLLMTSLKHKPSVIRMLTLKRLTGRKVWIDTDHKWEIGDGKHSVKDVENIMKSAGFKIEKFDKLPYVDFWVLKKLQ